MKNRRAFLRLAAFGVAAVGVPVTALAASAPAPESGPESDQVEPGSTRGEGPLWLFAPLTIGAEIGHGWSLARVFPAVQGAVTVTLAHDDGRQARIDLSLREGAARGPASTEFIDFIVMDGGDGKAPMAEGLGRAVMRLAAIVGDNEQQDLDTVARLLPHVDRVWRHADAMAVASLRLEPGGA